MEITLQQFHNSFRGLLQRFAPSHIKRWMWDREYRNGKWDCLDNLAGDCIFPHIERRGGAILDLGCGPGAIGNELNPRHYSEYTGIDISELAIEKARERNIREQNHYFAADIFIYEPDRKYDMILFGDSIYYFSHQQISEILSRYSPFLTPEGVFIVRTWVGGPRHKTIIANIERGFAVLEKHSYYDSTMIVLVFRGA